MEIKFKALKFEAGEQLTAFVEKKVSRLSRCARQSNTRLSF